MANGNGNGKRNLLVAVGVMVLSSAIVGLGANQFALANWRGRVDQSLDGLEHLRGDVSVVLKGIQGQEVSLQLIRSQLESLRGELSATRADFLSDASEHFRESDWEREKEILGLKFKELEGRLASRPKVPTKGS